jgi:hypothetical protein
MWRFRPLVTATVKHRYIIGCGSVIPLTESWFPGDWLALYILADTTLSSHLACNLHHSVVALSRVHHMSVFLTIVVSCSVHLSFCVRSRWTVLVVVYAPDMEIQWHFPVLQIRTQILGVLSSTLRWPNSFISLICWLLAGLQYPSNN